MMNRLAVAALLTIIGSGGKIYILSQTMFPVSSPFLSSLRSLLSFSFLSFPLLLSCDAVTCTFVSTRSLADQIGYNISVNL